MSYEHDLFISYAHIDNQPLTAEQQGWVTRFHATLAAQLSMRLGSVAHIWRDDKLRGNDVFTDEIVQQFGRTALLVSVLTPRYLASDWCRRELAAFCDEAARSGGLAPGNKARVFKVVKTPVADQATLPQQVRDTKGYEFFTDCDGAPLELDPAYGVRFSEAYFRMVGILAWELSQQLKTLQADPAQAANDAVPAPETGPIVYLAECTADRREARAVLEAELKLHGLRVLPDHPLPREDEARYLAGCAEMLARCALSIHLVGGVYGAVPDGQGDKSITVLQNELAARQCHSGQLTRLIWLPEATVSSQPQQQAFLRSLLEDDEAQYGADLLTGDIEQLKAAMHATLKKLAKPPPAAVMVVDEDGNRPARLVYLLCDERDRKASVPLRRWLRDQGVTVALPAFEGGAAAVREANEQAVASCDALLLFYGAGDEAWKRTTDSELQKRRGQRSGPALPLFTWLAEPATPDKDDLADLADAGLIDARQGFDASLLKPLLSAVLAGRRGRAEPADAARVGARG